MNSTNATINLSIHYPVKMFLGAWIGIFLLRTFGLLEHDSIEVGTYFLIFSFILFFLIGYYVTIIFRKHNKFKNVIKEKSYRNVMILYYIIVISSIICISFQLMKLRNVSNLYGTSLDLSGFNDNRINILSDDTYKVGSDIYGVISNILYGFPVLGILFSLYYRAFISKFQRISLISLFILGILVSFTSGGRFTAFVYIVVYLYSRYFFLVKHKLNKIQIVGLWIMGIGIFYIFAEMFRVRIGSDNLFQYVEIQDFIKPGPLATYINSNHSRISALTNIYMLFEYYCTLSINQLNYLFHSPYPASAPYLGGYQFATFNILLNKIGFNIVEGSKIVSELVNPGVYFSMVGAVFLDYNTFGIPLFMIIFGSIVANIFLRNKMYENIADNYMLILLLIILFMSPIISMISTGYFPSLILSSIFLYIYRHLYPLPSRQNLV